MATLTVGDSRYEIYRLDELQSQYDVARLPYTLRVLLENVLRNGSEDDVDAVARWDAKAEPSQEISFSPSRVLLQDFTGVPCVVDLAAMRDAMQKLGRDPKQINPQIPVELVIDHSVQVDEFATRLAIKRNAELEFERNRERYAFLRWGQSAFDNFKAVPPSTGICHQVNLEYLARGLAGLTLADRATLANMSPEYGATCGFFPVDEQTLEYLRLTGRRPERVALVEAYCKE